MTFAPVIGAKTNDRNVIIGAVAATCNERGAWKISLKRKERDCDRLKERHGAARGIKNDGGKWEERKRESGERAAFVSEFERRRNASYAGHCIYRVCVGSCLSFISESKHRAWIENCTYVGG